VTSIKPQFKPSLNLKTRSWKKEKCLAPIHLQRKDKLRTHDNQLRTVWTLGYPVSPPTGCNLIHLRSCGNNHSRKGVMLRSWPPYPNFPPFILRFRSLVPHSFPHAPLGPSPNHLTSHLIDHMTNPQSTITCHHSAVRSIMTCPHLTLFGLPAHDGVFLDCQLMMELYLEPPRHDFTLVIFPYFSVTSVTRYFPNVYKRSYF